MTQSFTYKSFVASVSVLSMLVLVSLSACATFSGDFDSSTWLEDETEAVDSHASASSEEKIKTGKKEVWSKNSNQKKATKHQYAAVDKHDVVYDENVKRNKPKAVKPLEEKKKIVRKKTPVPYKQPVKEVAASMLETAVKPEPAVVESFVQDTVATEKTATDYQIADVSPLVPFDDDVFQEEIESPRGIEESNKDFAGVSFLAATIYFPHGSERLSEKSLNMLREVIEMRRVHKGKIRVVGHASSRTRNMEYVEHVMANFNVSMKRASTVCSALIKLGAPPKHVFFGAASDNEPIYYEVMPSGEALNRRAEIFIDY